MKSNIAKQARTKKLAVCALAFSSVMAAGSVNAQWVVTDPGHTVQNVVQQIMVSGERAIEFGKQIDEWKKQYEHFQQQLIKFQSFLNNPIALPNSEPWVELNKTEVVKQKCGDAGGSLLGRLMDSVGLQLNGDLAKQQLQVCVNIESAKVDKFNYTVKFARDSVPQMQSLLGKIQGQRGTSSSQGNIQGVDSESMRLANDLDIKYQSWQAQMKTYDAYIAAMMDKQNTLATRALKGQASPLGQAISTAAMAGALQ